MNKVVYVGVGMYVLDPSCTSADLRPAHWNITPRVNIDFPTQTINLTPSRLIGL